MNEKDVKTLGYELAALRASEANEADRTRMDAIRTLLMSREFPTYRQVLFTLERKDGTN